MFRNMMGVSSQDDGTDYAEKFERAFRPQPGLEASYLFRIEGNTSPLSITVEGSDLKCLYKENDNADVELQLTKERLRDVLAGNTTFQRAFMAGEMKMKGDYKALRLLDTVFVFA